MNDYVLRFKPTSSDIKRIEEILSASKFFNKDEITMGVSLVKERIKHGDNCSYKFVFLENDFGVAGYTCYGFIDGTKSSYDLYWIAVANNFKRQGYGTILLRETEKQISELKGHNIYIETSSTPLYKPTREFYKKSGYIEEATIKNFYDTDDHKIIYSKSV